MKLDEVKTTIQPRTNVGASVSYLILLFDICVVCLFYDLLKVNDCDFHLNII